VPVARAVRMGRRIVPQGQVARARRRILLIAVAAAVTAAPVVAGLAATPVATALRRPAAAAPHPGTLHRPSSGLGPPVGERSRPEAAVPAVVHRGVTERGRPPEAAIVWRRSRALGRPDRGRLVGGVELPAAGTHFVTVDPVTGTSPNRAWRRHGTDRLVELLLRVAAEHAAAHPDAPRLVVGDLSRPRGGRFGKEYGGDGHRSHQNGLDADVFYPRRDGRERIPTRVAQIDRRLAQELVDRFVRAGARYVFVGPRTGLRGPSKVVMTLGNHDDHLHVRIRPRATAGR
jgi:Penicillin-insensitive murein endopeptidase